ncbi:RimK/LysX family protein [Photobacterium sp. DA100]|uniref:ATP-dependent zinc protease family protein n=1 Tax=Photobacterium sp. DA100 TaxID=3027472 RepID=UPI00247A6DF9|nr:RimK/LysX family protein [Photobacterium sp. DA100]WEM43181.1 RimK/LysX family protein [Photobacterium sp. DA100]
MLRRFVPLLTFAVLSGCSLTQPQQDHEQTMQAINVMEDRVNFQLATMIKQIDDQNAYIANLETKISTLSDDMSQRYSDTALLAFNEEEEKAVPVPEIRDNDPRIAHGKVILGEEEWVWLDATQSFYKARVDTGATTSSVSATNIQIFERDGKEWARFNMNHTSDENPSEADMVEAPVVRWVKIRQASASDLNRRPVIEAWVKLGQLHEKAQFTLADRTQMTYPVLLGREFFKDIALVDVGKKFVQGMNEQQVQQN